MKFNPVIIFIASLASGVDASGNLRSRQNLEEEVQSHAKPLVYMKGQQDAPPLLEGNHEIITASGQHVEENNGPATFEKHQKMEYEEDSYYKMTMEETEELIQEVEALEDEATLTDPEIGNLDRWYEEEPPSVKELIQEERVGIHDIDPTETRAPVAKPTAPPSWTLLKITLWSDSDPESTLVQVIDAKTTIDIHYFYPTLPNSVTEWSKWLPSNGCYLVVGTHGEEGGLKGNGIMKVQYGQNTWCGKKIKYTHANGGSPQIFSRKFGGGC